MSPINLFESQAVIKVIGVGGGGCNALNRMVESGLEGVDFVAMNTDRQALQASLAPVKVALGVNTTRGLGTGGNPERGEASAKEAEREILDLLDGSDMVFITAGMGGGTGTGAAPVVAELAKRLDILTVGVVTRPFDFEGPRRRKTALSGLEKLKAVVDTLIVVPNNRLIDVVERKTSLSGAFLTADDVLRQGVQGISDIITKPGLINVDFADVKTVMQNAGVALMGLGRATGDNRARLAAEMAANSPMLETTIQGARRILVNITGGENFSIGEAQDAMEYIMQLADAEDADIFMGQVVDPAHGDAVSVTLLAAGMDSVTTPRKEDSTVFHAPTEPVRANPAEIQIDTQTMPARNKTNPVDLDDLELDIPTFLRRQRSNTQ